MDIERKFLKLLNEGQSNPKPDNSSFAICPKIFYSGLSEDEFRSMQQIYRTAYENARAKTQNNIGGFYNGEGI